MPAYYEYGNHTMKLVVLL